MNKYKITWIGEKKDITTKFGVKQKFSIKVEGNDNYLGVWASATTNDWKVGQEVEGNITTSAGRDGKIFYNFELPKKNDIALEKVLALDITVDMLKRRYEPMYQDWLKKQDTKTRGYEYPTEEANPNFNIDDIPFP